MTKSTKSKILLVMSALLVLLLFASISSAYGGYNNYYPSYRSSYSSSYSESPGYSRYGVGNSNALSSSSSSSFNRDATAYSADYRGPLYTKTTSYSQDLLIDRSSRSGFFTSRSNDIYHDVVSLTTTEKYIGATESVYYGTQNNRQSSSGSSNSASSSYDDGFSWGKARVYDSSEYQNNNYGNYGNYYYSPYYDTSGGYYNWDY